MTSPARTLAAATCLAFALAACGTGTGASSAADPATSAKADAALAALRNSVMSKGPHGETAATAASVTLTPEEEAQVKAKNATAAIVLHYGGNDWSQAQVEGLRSELGRLGITVLAVTDANFKPDKQVSDLETVMTRKPNVIISIPADPVATAAEYKKVAESGTRLVFMDNVPKGLVAGTDYTSVVSADNFANGVASAHLMAKSLGGQGKIGVIFHQADFFVTQQRYDGFTSTLRSDYPGIQIVEEKGIAGPDFAGDAQAAANALLTKNPTLNGIWAVWDVPAEGVMAAARAGGRQDLVVATEDLGTNVAISLAKNDLVKGLGAQRPFDQGVAEARLAAYALIGKPAPAYVALEALPVNHENVLQAWTQVYHQPAPADLRQAYAK